MYKMVVEITKETWEKYDIKTINHYYEKENKVELLQKTQKISQKKENKNTRHIFKAKLVFLLLKNLHVI